MIFTGQSLLAEENCHLRFRGLMMYDEARTFGGVGVRAVFHELFSVEDTG
jgi:hypothetical protein